MKYAKELEQSKEKAKELEKTSVPTTEEIVDIYKEGMEEAEKLKKLLKPQWFIDDECKHKKSKKAVKKTQKTSKSTIKKKSL